MRNTLATSTSFGLAKTNPSAVAPRPAFRVHSGGTRHQRGWIYRVKATGRWAGIALLWVALAAAAIPVAAFCAAWIVGNSALRVIEPKMLSAIKQR